MGRCMDWLLAWLRWYPITLHRWVESPGKFTLLSCKFWQSWIGWRYVYWREPEGWNWLRWRE